MADDVQAAPPPTPLQAVEQQIETLQRKRRDLLRLAYYKKLMESEAQAFGLSWEATLVDLINKGLEAEINRLSKALAPCNTDKP